MCLNHVLLWRSEIVESIPIISCARPHLNNCLCSYITNFICVSCKLRIILEQCCILSKVICKISNWGESNCKSEPIAHWNGLSLLSKKVKLNSCCQRSIQILNSNCYNDKPKNYSKPCKNKQWENRTRYSLMNIFTLNVKSDLVTIHIEIA